MRATGEVRWCASLAENPRGGTAAWIVTLAEVEAWGGVGLTPSGADRDDVGARRGAEAERFLRRRLALRGLVARWSDLPAPEVVVGYGRNGRPEVRVPQHGPFCSVTARGEIAGFALSSAPVGVDLEPATPGEIAWAVLSADERAEVAALPPHEQHAAFLELWTLKEAYLKALGSGLLRDPSTLSISRRERLIRDGRHIVPLSASALRHPGPQPLTAACISLPRRHA